MSWWREQAVRLVRTKWGDRADLLAEELSLILSGADDPVQNPITVSLNDDSTIELFPPGFGSSPFNMARLPPLDMPNFDLPFFSLRFDFEEQPAFTEEGEPATYNSDVRKRIYTQTLRSAIPGRIVGGTENIYTVDLYPNGSTALDDDGLPITVRVSGVRQLQIASGETIPAGTWVCPIFRCTTAEISVRDTLINGKVVRRSMGLEITRQVHEMQVPVWLSPLAEEE